MHVIVPHWVTTKRVATRGECSFTCSLSHFTASGNSIRKVAVSFYLYAPKGPDGRDYSFENKLASLEEWFSTPFWATVTGSYIDLCDETMRKSLALLTAVMYLRNPKHLDVMHQIHRSIVESCASFPEVPDGFEINGQSVELDKSSWPVFRDATEEDVRRMWLNEVGSAVWLAKMFLEMRFAILLADAPVFITSDNPVVPVHKTLRFRGFKDPETTVFFPLSPTRVLVLDNRL